jgi:uncharacterized linocin/CFP29 family protein
MADLNWSDAQWQKVNACVSEAFGKASVASAFLTSYGPLAGNTETVRNELVKKDETKTSVIVRLDGDHDDANARLVNMAVQVLLSSEQVADETLANAMLAFRRAANMLAQEQDRIVFDGYDHDKKPSLLVTNNPKRQKGLADEDVRKTFEEVKDEPRPAAEFALAGSADRSGRRGQGLVSSVAKAIRTLEDRSYPGPFACVLGNKLYDDAHEATFSLALPADRITPLLKGPLLRSGNMQDDTGIVISLAANAIDIVVGTTPTVQWLQRREDGKFVFRVYVRFVMRIRDKIEKNSGPVAGFRIKPQPNRAAGKRVGNQRRARRRPTRNRPPTPEQSPTS